jgi:hypothetical protein
MASLVLVGPGAPTRRHGNRHRNGRLADDPENMEAHIARSAGEVGDYLRVVPFRLRAAGAGTQPVSAGCSLDRKGRVTSYGCGLPAFLFRATKRPFVWQKIATGITSLFS